MKPSHIAFPVTLDISMGWLRDTAPAQTFEHLDAGDMPLAHSFDRVTGKKDTSGLLCGFLNNPQRARRG
jgi:hypothetical protein